MSEARNESIADRIANPNEYDRNLSRCRFEQCNCRIAESHDHVGRGCEKLSHNRPHLVERAGPPARFDTSIAAIDPSQMFESLQKSGKIGFPELSCRGAHENGNPSCFARLLRARPTATPPRRQEA